MQEPVTTFEVNGQVIWAKRMKAGLSVGELAAQTGISDSYVRKLERGLRKHMGPGPYLRMRTVLRANATELLLDPTEDPGIREEVK